MVPTWPSTQLLSASAHGHSELWRSLQRTRRATRWLSEETRDATRRRARALTSDAATTTEHDAVAPTPVRSTILQQCSHLPSRRRRTSREPPRNTDLESATKLRHRVFTVRVAPSAPLVWSRWRSRAPPLARDLCSFASRLSRSLFTSGPCKALTL